MGLDSAAVRQEENMYLALMPETYMGWVEIDGEMADPIRLLG
jgi:hypothetical protein